MKIRFHRVDECKLRKILEIEKTREGSIDAAERYCQKGPVVATHITGYQRWRIASGTQNQLVRKRTEYFVGVD